MSNGNGKELLSTNGEWKIEVVRDVLCDSGGMSSRAEVAAIADQHPLSVANDYRWNSNRIGYLFARIRRLEKDGIIQWSIPDSVTSGINRLFHVVSTQQAIVPIDYELKTLYGLRTTFAYTATRNFNEAQAMDLLKLSTPNDRRLITNLIKQLEGAAAGCENALPALERLIERVSGK